MPPQKIIDVDIRQGYEQHAGDLQHAKNRQQRHLHQLRLSLCQAVAVVQPVPSLVDKVSSREEEKSSGDEVSLPRVATAEVEEGGAA